PKDSPQIIAFDTYAVDLDRFEPQGGNEGELKPRERYYSELVTTDPKCRSCKTQAGQFRSELHERFASMLYPIAFAFIIIAFVGQARSTRSSRMESLVVAFLAAAGCRLGGLALNNLVTAKAAYVPAMYLLPVAAIALSLLVIKGADRHRSGLGAIDKIVEALAPLVLRISTMLGRKRAGAAAP
ncbi:MAG: LptF/LptG family permease, partial [Hyphomicrobium sp.]